MYDVTRKEILVSVCNNIKMIKYISCLEMKEIIVSSDENGIRR